MDFVQSFVNTEFGVNYLADDSLEIFDDPAAVAMSEVGLLYQQRDPSFMCPITRGIQHCLACSAEVTIELSRINSIPMAKGDTWAKLLTLNERSWLQVKRFQWIRCPLSILTCKYATDMVLTDLLLHLMNVSG